MSDNQLAIIAGGGNLSEAIIKSANDKGWDVTVFAIGDLNITKNQCYEYLSAFEINSKIGLNLIKRYYNNIPIPFNNKFNYNFHIIK